MEGGVVLSDICMGSPVMGPNWVPLAWWGVNLPPVSLISDLQDTKVMIQCVIGVRKLSLWFMFLGNGVMEDAGITKELTHWSSTAAWWCGVHKTVMYAILVSASIDNKAACV